jgi:hypothetical protein
VPEAGDISADEFRRAGHQLINWIAEYWENPERFPVLSRSRPGDITRALPTAAPDQPESLDTMLRDFEQIILPGVTHWNHPGFLAYFAVTGSAPGVLGELLSAALNVNAMLWRTSPAATELEEVTLDWLRQLLDLPERCLVRHRFDIEHDGDGSGTRSVRPGRQRSGTLWFAALARLLLRSGPLLDREGGRHARNRPGGHTHHPL